MIFDIGNDRDLELLGGLDQTAFIVGVTSGCFDLLHTTHLLFLERCRRQCGFLIVGIDSDATVLANKQKVPVIHEQERLLMVHGLRCVDAVFTLNDAGLDLPKIVESLSYPLQVKVFKHSNQIYGAEVFLEKLVVIIPDVTPTTSTTELKRRLNQNPT